MSPKQITNNTDKAWKVIPEGDDEHIPLWKALAQLTSKDTDEGLKSTQEVITRERSKIGWDHNAIVLRPSLTVYAYSVCLLVLASRMGLAHWLISHSMIPTIAAVFAATVGALIYCQVQQYGYGRAPLLAALSLPHEADSAIDRIVSYFQREDGPQAYYRSFFGKKLRPIEREVFFGKLRYFLFSKEDADRCMVLRFRSILFCPPKLFVHRDDLKKMVEMNKPKRKGGPGRNCKYKYDDAAAAVSVDPRLDILDLSDRKAAIRTITTWLEEWFKVHADASGGVPQRKYLTSHATKIYNTRLQTIKNKTKY